MEQFGKNCSFGEEMKVITTLKIVIITLVGFFFLIYLTATPPQKNTRATIELKNLPKTVKLLGHTNQLFNTSSIIVPDSIIFVGNQESIALAYEINNALKLPIGKFIVVSNSSDTPWFIKKWQTDLKALDLPKNPTIPWIYDKDGKIRFFLKVPTSEPKVYFIYKVDKDGIVTKLLTSRIKLDPKTLKISPQSIKEEVAKIVSKVGE